MMLRNNDGTPAELVTTVFLSYADGTWLLVPSTDPDWTPMDVADAAADLAAGRSVVVRPGDVAAVQRAVKRLQAGAVA